MYTIPKNEDWNYNLSNMRPIVLLEAFRKTVVRIIIYRLDHIFVKHNILKSSNYTGLLENSIIGFKYIMNNLLENIRQKNKEV